MPLYETVDPNKFDSAIAVSETKIYFLKIKKIMCFQISQ